jgi:hypothetical protein
MEQRCGGPLLAQQGRIIPANLDNPVIVARLSACSLTV